MIRWLIHGLALCGIALLAGCGQPAPKGEIDGGPALWRVERDGLDGWLFGTIHVLPKGVKWQTPAIRQAWQQADRLILEAAGLQDPQETLALFEKMGLSPGLPPLDARVPPKERRELDRIVADGRTSVQALSAYESWAAAMLLSAAAQQSLHVSEENGVEPALIATFQAEGKPIDGLETVERQFGAFDTLPEAAQRKLLVQTIHEAKNMTALYNRILAAWAKGDMEAIAKEGRNGEQPDPVVEKAILTARNHDWATAMDRLKGRPFIAVGAGHLTGKDNLVALLTAKGYRVTRLQ